MIAEDVRGAPLGAAWYRLFDPAAPGYGFVDAATPELAIAVLPAARGIGIGRALLGALRRTARESGLRAVRLSVEIENPAQGFYERHGFVRVGAGAGAWTMRRSFAADGGSGGG